MIVCQLCSQLFVLAWGLPDGESIEKWQRTINRFRKIVIKCVNAFLKYLALWSDRWNTPLVLTKVTLFIALWKQKEISVETFLAVFARKS